MKYVHWKGLVELKIRNYHVSIRMSDAKNIKIKNMVTDFSDDKYIALIGNPNCGKIAVFNHLTSLNQKVSNYPGVRRQRKLE